MKICLFIKTNEGLQLVRFSCKLFTIIITQANQLIIDREKTNFTSRNMAKMIALI